MKEGAILRLGQGPLISAILPVKNRGHHLPELFDRIRAQECPASVEILAVDSGSSDDTVDVLQSSGCTVLSVPEESFDYGLTRNAAAEIARGEFLLFISSTMLPADRHWLRPLLERMEGSDRLAGVYSRGIPSPRSSLLNRRDYLRADLLTNRRNFSEVTEESDPLLRQIANRQAYNALSPEDRRQFISFSNVSSLVRASIFAAHPFAKVDSCGEDMLWAREVLEAGFAIRYEPRSIVIYSHDYGPGDLFRRSFDDFLGNRSIAAMQLPAAAVLPTIRSIILDDWRYLGSSATEDEKIDAALRRIVQVTGQWLGANWIEYGDSLEGLLAYLSDAEVDESAQELLRTLMRFAASSQGGEGDSLIPENIQSRVRRDWCALNETMSEDARIAAVLEASAEFAGRWVADYRQHFSSGLRENFSLIESIRRGYRTGDMSPARISGTGKDRRSPAVSSGQSWSADLEAMNGVLEIHEREFFSANEELEKRAVEMSRQNAVITALQRQMEEAISQRDSQIRALQAELQEKVALRDQMIRDLQQEMHTKVWECNRIIQDLQEQLAKLR